MQGIGDTDLLHTRLSLIDSRFEKGVEMEPSSTLDINLLFALHLRQVSPFFPNAVVLSYYVNKRYLAVSPAEKTISRATSQAKFGRCSPHQLRLGVGYVYAKANLKRNAFRFPYEPYPRRTPNLALRADSY